MILEQFLLSVNETNSYVIACSETNEAAIIDPGEWNDQIIEFLEVQGLNLKKVFVTHSHEDHTGGIEEIKNQFNVDAIGYGLEFQNDHSVVDGDIIEVGDLKIKVLETPGHTSDSLAFVIGCDVFCGDLIFAGSIGSVSNKADHDIEVQMIREKVFPLGDDMVLHPGHGPATTVLLERLFNPLLIP